MGSFFSRRRGNATGQNAASSNASSQPNQILKLYGAKSFEAIRDRFTTLQQVTDALRQAGLESSSLIFAIDYTMSNMQQGKRTFGGRSLHALDSSGEINPYQSVIMFLGETLAPFDDDGLIPAFGFGDIQTKDRGVFPMKPDGTPCNGFTEVLERYREVTPYVKLSGPTNFAPAIYKAIETVKETKQYHILVIVADGQVTSEQATIQAIVEASHYPLSIVLVGVGDGPWDTMEEFDDQLPQREFDNFQFVEFSKAVTNVRNPQASFALAALMEIPDQFFAIRRLKLLDRV